MVRKGFDSFINTIDIFVREEMSRQTDSIIYSQLSGGENYESFRSIPLVDTSVLSTVRDIDDGVMYFMVGIDRINRPAKVGA